MIKKRTGTGSQPCLNKPSDSSSRDRRDVRPRNASETRTALLGAARTLFAVAGYKGASLRDIAHQAGVDVSLISRYFGSKDGLFQAVVSFERDRLTAATHGTATERAKQLLTNAMADPMDTEYDLLITLLRSSGYPAATDSMRSLLEVLEADLAKVCDDPDRDMRAALTSAMLIGIAVQCRLLHKPPLSTASVDELVPLFRRVLSCLLPRRPRKQPRARPGTRPAR